MPLVCDEQLHTGACDVPRLAQAPHSHQVATRHAAHASSINIKSPELLIEKHSPKVEQQDDLGEEPALHTSTNGRMLSVKVDLAKVQLTSPACTEIGEKVVLSCQIEKHSR